MRCKYLWVLISLLILLAVTTVFAESESETEPQYKEEVVVTATRTPEEQLSTPGTTEVITREEIEESGATTVAELLAEEGFVISTYGGGAGVATLRIDGSSAEQTLIMINGVPANTSTVGTVDLSYFPVDIIERVEIVHGPLSALYGSSALGGVVNIITDLTGEPQNKLLLSSGSNSAEQLGLTIKRQNYGIAVGTGSTNGHRPHSKTETDYFFGQYDFYNTETGYLSLHLQLMNKSGEDPGSIQWPSTATQSEKNQSINLIGKSSWNQLSFEYKLFIQSLEYQYRDYLTDKHETTNYGVDLAGLYPWGNHQLLAGVMLKDASFDSTKSGKNQQHSGAILLQDQWFINEELILISGFRWDTGSDFSSPLSPRIALVKLINDSLSLKVGYGKAFRAPTVNELYFSEISPWFKSIGNPDLKPEIGDRIDLIGEWKKDKYAITVNLYHAKLSDGISWVESQPATWTPINIDKVNINGLNLRWQRKWDNGLGVQLGYSLVDRTGWDETTRDYSNELNFFGKQQINLGVNYQNSNWGSSLNWNSVQDRKQGDQIMPDYDLLNLNLYYLINQDLKLNLSLCNIFDQDYQIHEGYPMPGKEYRIGLNYYF
ncbi:MAG TPA: TonB-dependent receptor [Bacillota bacterium]|nr:TonB-dependent receptor [Bacillota bacterium]HOL10828.1 TonB-dependent receptor [Bacillota bacterium]HPO98670.1 TonB-dependent receptor [Bacillota bacterium]